MEPYLKMLKYSPSFSGGVTVETKNYFPPLNQSTPLSTWEKPTDLLHSNLYYKTFLQNQLFESSLLSLLLDTAADQHFDFTLQPG